MANPLHFRSYLKFLDRNRLYTAINVFGLSVSLMFVIIIAIYTVQEFSTDSFQEKADRIYAVGNEDWYGSGYGLVPYLTSRYPEIEMACAVRDRDNTPVRHPGSPERISADILFADSTFFRMFSFPLTEGDPAHVLATKSGAVVSESFARKMFPGRDPMGQAIQLEEDFTVNVTGVMKDFGNTMFPKSDIVINLQNFSRYNPSIANDNMNNAGGVIIFLLTYPGTDIVSKTADMAEYFKDFYWIYERDLNTEVILTPMRKVYFDREHEVSIPLRQGDRQLVNILFSVGILILLFAVINYINLTVAQTGFRAKEMASRRLLGASKGEIFWKFIAESTLMCAIGFMVGVLLVWAVENAAGNILQTKIDVSAIMSWQYVIPSVALIVMLGVLSGLIPAVFISHYKPIDVVRGSFRMKSKMVFSKVFIVFQNVITIALLAGSLTIMLQIRHMVNAPLGYKADNLIKFWTWSGFESFEDVDTFGKELENLAAVRSVSFTRGTPIDRGNNNTFVYEERNISLQVLEGDTVFFRLMDFEILRDNKVSGDRYWLNEQAMAELGLDHDAPSVKMWNETFIIAGVLKNFRLGSAMQERTDPVMVVERMERQFPWSILVETGDDRDEALSQVKNAYKQYTGLEFSGQYYDDIWRESYAPQRRTLTIVTIFTAIAIVISMLGLLAMSTYFIQQRAGGTAVRKVFGSTRGEVFRQLVFNFLRLVLIAFVIAAPVIWFVMRRWLSDYPYRIGLSPWIFVAAGAAALLIAAVTVSWQSARAANSNPIDSIKG